MACKYIGQLHLCVSGVLIAQAARQGYHCRQEVIAGRLLRWDFSSRGTGLWSFRSLKEGLVIGKVVNIAEFCCREHTC